MQMPAFLAPTALQARRPIAPSSRRAPVCACVPPAQTAAKPLQREATRTKADANGSADANGAPKSPAPPPTPSPREKSPSRALARVGRVESRPELVGGLPLYAAAGAIAQLARLARNILSGGETARTRTLRSADTASVQKDATTELRDLALRLERETDALRDELAAAKASAATWREATAVGEARYRALVEAQAAAAASRDAGAADIATRQLFALLMSAQTSLAFEKRGNAVLRARLLRATSELQSRERDLVQTGLVAAVAVATLAVAVSKLAGVEGISDVVRHAIETR